MSRFFDAQPVTAYVDMDGVLVPWVEQVFALYGVPMPPGRQDYEEVYNVDPRKGDGVWDRINALGADWWAGLPAYPWARELWSRLQGLGINVAVLTSPCTEGHSALGKVRWLRKHIAPDFRDYVITSKKWRLAHPRAVLIDDTEGQLSSFRRYGGIAVRFPQPWNNAGECKPESVVDTVVSNVQAELLRAGLML